MIYLQYNIKLQKSGSFEERQYFYNKDKTQPELT